MASLYLESNKSHSSIRFPWIVLLTQPSLQVDWEMGFNDNTTLLMVFTLCAGTFCKQVLSKINISIYVNQALGIQDMQLIAKEGLLRILRSFKSDS